MSPLTIEQQISSLSTANARFRVKPIVPRTAFRDLFLVKDVNSEAVTLSKIEMDEPVRIPTSRIMEVIDAGANESKVLVLNGRLQHVTPAWQWQFFEDVPAANSELGFVNKSGAQDPVVVGLISELAHRFDFQWGAVDELSMNRQKGWVVFYDDRGFCYVAPERYRDTILIAKKKTGGAS